ncbi:MAG: hypothetical protein M3Y22_16115, partial [Pseudomonadota bacterium]|nr:hypothetical protein [Pseudomonadota bacterium]
MTVKCQPRKLGSTQIDGVEVLVEGDRGPVVMMLHGWPDTCAFMGCTGRRLAWSVPLRPLH